MRFLREGKARPEYAAIRKLNELITSEDAKKRELLKQPGVESVEFWTAKGTEDNTIDSWGDIRAAIRSCKQNGYDYVVRCVTYRCPEGVSEEDFYATDGFDWEVVWENPTRG